MMNGFEGSESQKLTHRVVKVNLEIQFTSRIEICQVKGMCGGYVRDDDWGVKLM